MYKLVNSIIKAAFLTLLYLFFLSPVNAIEITNKSFETAEEGWSKTTSTVQFTISTTESHDATRSAELNYTSTTSQGIKQTVPTILPDKTYKISADIKTTTAKKALIRIAWYQTGSTSQIKTDDSPIIGANTNWNQNEYIVTAPTNAASAELRLLVSEGTAYFDHISMDEYIEPTQIPTPTTIISPADTSLTPTSFSVISSPTPTLYNNIYISEAFIYPDSGMPEWVELYNANAYSVTLNGWYIDDTADSGSLPKTINVTIPANGYAVVEMTSALFNNDGDSIRLLDSNKAIKDTIEYTSSQKSHSIGRNNFTNNIVCIENSTKGKINDACITIGTNEDTEEDISPTKYVSPSITSKSNKLLQTPTPSLPIKKMIKTILTKHSPVILPPAGDKILSKEEINKPQKKQKSASLLAASYSLLSFVSIGAKMIIGHD